MPALLDLHGGQTAGMLHFGQRRAIAEMLTDEGHHIRLMVQASSTVASGRGLTALVLPPSVVVRGARARLNDSVAPARRALIRFALAAASELMIDPTLAALCDARELQPLIRHVAEAQLRDERAHAVALAGLLPEICAALSAEHKECFAVGAAHAVADLRAADGKRWAAILAQLELPGGAAQPQLLSLPADATALVDALAATGMGDFASLLESGRAGIADA